MKSPEFAPADKKLPIPTHGGHNRGQTKYPFAKMEVGGKPVRGKVSLIAMRSAIRRYRLQNGNADKRFIARNVGGGITVVWRTA